MYHGVEVVPADHPEAVAAEQAAALAVVLTEEDHSLIDQVAVAAVALQEEGTQDRAKQR